MESKLGDPFDHDPLTQICEDGVYYGCVQIVVRVMDVNDNYPIASVNTPYGTSTGSGNTDTSASVPENSDVGSYVAHISVIDADTGPSGQVNSHLFCS